MTIEVPMPLRETDLVVIDNRPLRVQAIEDGEIRLAVTSGHEDIEKDVETFKRMLRDAESVQFIR